MVAAPAPPPVAPPAPPSPPSADDVLHGELADLGAAQGTDGWNLSIATASFKGGKVSFDSDDQSKINKVIDILRNTPDLRVVIGGYPDGRGSKAHQAKNAQLHANAVLRDMTRNGADAGRIQAIGKDADPTKRGIDLAFSDAEGQFSVPNRTAANR